MVRYATYTQLFLLAGSAMALPRNYFSLKAAKAEAASPAVGACPAGQQTCANDGTMYCISPSQYGLCNRGCMIAQAVAAGTHCTGTPGVIAMGDAGSAGSSPSVPVVAPSSGAAASPPAAAAPSAASSAPAAALPSAAAPPVPASPASASVKAPAGTSVPDSAPAAQKSSQSQAPAVPAPTPASSAAPAVVAPTTPAAAPAASPTQQSAPAAASQPAKPAAAGGQVDASMIKQIMPNSATCSGGDHGSECRTADQAAPFVNSGFDKYKITSKAAKAAILATQALESGEYKYNTPISPVEGKGTRNMQSLAYNTKYATSLYGAGKLQGLDGNGILALVLNDGDSFASSSWLLATQCPDVLKQFDTDAEGAWTAMIGPGCISTTMTSQRIAYWTAAKKALGV